MGRRFLLAAIVLGFAASAAAARDLADVLQEKGILTGEEAAAVAPGANDLRVFWKDGIRFATADEAFSLRLLGRVHFDATTAFSSDSLRADFPGVSASDTGIDLRRARIGMAGTIYRSVVFKAEYEFADGDTEFKDLFVGLVDVPWVGSVSVGYFKEPFSFEEIMSTNHISFLERGLPNAMVPSRNNGVMLANAVADERVTWAIGGFRASDDFASGFGADATYNLTGRVTGLPVYRDGGRRLVHAGLAYSHQFRNEDEVRYRARPESASFPARLVDSGTIVADGVDLLGPEAAAVWGPLSLQAEYVQAWIDATAGSDPRWHGYYVSAAYFLTGESRTYVTDEGIFGRTRPARNFALDGSGWGAWEVLLRYSNLDVEQEGDELDDVTVGLNWYLNPNARVMANYVHGDVDGSGDANILQMRFQVDF